MDNALEKELLREFDRFAHGRSLTAIYECENLNLHEQAILLYFGHCAGFQSDGFVVLRPHKRETIALKTRMSVDTVKRTLKSLLDRGYIDRVRKYADNGVEITPEYKMTWKIFDEYEEKWLGTRAKDVRLVKPASNQDSSKNPNDLWGGYQHPRGGCEHPHQNQGSEKKVNDLWGGCEHPRGGSEHPLLSNQDLNTHTHTAKPEPVKDPYHKTAIEFTQKLKTDYVISSDPALMAKTLGLCAQNLQRDLRWMAEKYDEWALYLASRRPFTSDPAHTLFNWVKGYRDTPPPAPKGKSPIKPRPRAQPTYNETTDEELERLLGKASRQ